MSFFSKLILLFGYCLFFALTLHANEIIATSYSIRFFGEKTIEKKQLEEALGVKNKHFYQFWKDDDPRIDSMLLESLEDSLKSLYESEGFYDTKFSIEEGNTSIHVHIVEDKPIRVETVSISSDYNISSLVSFKAKEIFKASDFIRIKSDIIKALLKDGYCSYDLNAKAYVDLDTKKVSLEYLLKKGGLCTFGKLTIEGLETVDKEVITSAVRAVEGEVFNTELIQESANSLYALDAFDTVLIRTDRKFYNVVPVDIVFQEKVKPYHFEVGAGYDTYVGFRVHAEMTKSNFLGNAQKLHAKVAWSTKEQLLEANYFKPVLFQVFDSAFDLGMSVGYSNLEFEGFQEEKSFAKAYLSYTSAKVKLKFGLSTENIFIQALDNIKEGSDLEHAVNEGAFLLFYPYIDIVYDARDSKLNPKYGYYLSAYTEMGIAEEVDDSAYVKILFEGRLIYTWEKLTFSTVGHIGVIDESSDNGLPESKYFFGGGSYSNRAYGYKEIGVILSPTEESMYGASSFLNLSIEMNYPIWGDVYGAVFSDNTMLNEESYDFDGEILSSVGMGIRYMTPIGPFKLDVGVNRKDRSQYGILFQIGQSF